MAFDNLKLDRELYLAGKGFSRALEEIDPSEQYRGTALEGLDAYERQLKRFGIHVSGAGSDRLEKFFQNADSAALFPEYVTRAVQKGLEDANKLSGVVAVTTRVEGLDYRSLEWGANTPAGPFTELDELAYFGICTKEHLVAMKKYGRFLTASYEALRYHRLDLLTVILRKIGADIAGALMDAAADVLINGDGNTNTAAAALSIAGTSLAYEDLIALWNSFGGYSMTTILAAPDIAQEILALPEMRDGCAGLDFHGSGNLVTPLGAELIISGGVPDGSLVALDKNCALEMVEAGGIVTDFDRMIQRQLHEAGISVTAGFAKISPEAAVVLS